MEGIVDVIDAFVCPITGEVLLDPVLAADGHTYSRAAIAKWFERRQTSPLTGAQLPLSRGPRVGDSHGPGTAPGRAPSSHGCGVLIFEIF